MKPVNCHEGDRSEYMALFAFSTIAYCTMVPRQFDKFGVDFYAHLARKEEDNLVSIGRAVAVQVKSAGAPIELKSQELRNCLYDQTLPFFLAEIDKQTSHIRVFSMFNRIWQFWVNPAIEVRLRLMPKPNESPATDGYVNLYLGKPIFESSLADLENDALKEQRRAEFLASIESWARWEQLHLAWKEDNLPVITQIEGYETNVALPLADLTHDMVEHHVATNPEYWEGAMSSVIKSLYGVQAFCEHMRDDIAHFQGVGFVFPDDFSERTQAIIDHLAALQPLLSGAVPQPPNSRT